MRATVCKNGRTRRFIVQSRHRKKVYAQIKAELSAVRVLDTATFTAPSSTEGRNRSNLKLHEILKEHLLIDVIGIFCCCLDQLA